MQKIYSIIAGIAIAMVTLIAFQLYWIDTSKKLLEDQFTNRVNMALCTAVEKISTEPSCCKAIKTSCKTNPNDCNEQITKIVNDPTFRSILQSSLSFYNINLPYKTTITSKDNSHPDNPSFSCSLAPIVAADDHWLQIIFDGKKEYFRQKMGFTLLFSLFIIGSILSLFVYSARALIKQQKLSEDNRHFFNHMTHEFNTPLANIQLATKMLAKNKEPEKKFSYLQIINQQCSQLKSQVENVLHMASVDQKHFQLNKEVVNIIPLIHEVIDSMALQIESRQANVQLNTIDAEATILADPLHIKNVIRNLIDNALKYGGTKPAINIDVASGDQGYEIKVKDTGTGITSADQKYIFDSYFRCKDHQDSAINGFGLGLAYVKKIMQMHMGDIKIGSGSNQGASIELYLPKA